MKRYIEENLKKYTARPLSPWHMPGHKRRPGFGGFWDPLFALDVTEVPGTDDYHHAEGFIRQSQEEAAKVYGAAFSHYLVGGSTAGILAGILALAGLWRERREREEHSGGSEAPVFLTARNVHRSVHNALRLAGAEAVILEPEGDVDYGPVMAEEVRRVLRAEEDSRGAVSSHTIAGCILTSPTYGGAISPLREIHEILSEAGIPLLVDEAHGAHLPFISGLAQYGGSACGAELVVQSLHKTLPALTQVGIIHVGAKAFADKAGTPEPESLEKALQRQLSVVQSSSPSYLLLASAENAVAWADEHREAFDSYILRVKAFRERLRHGLKKLVLVEHGIMQDPTRFHFRPDEESCPMTALAGWLEDAYGIVAELAGSRELILISTAVDREEDLQRLFQALSEAEEGLLSPCGKVKDTADTADPLSEVREEKTEGKAAALSLTPGEETTEDIYVYPPGTLILRKGERVTEEALDRIRQELKAGRRVYGAEEGSMN